jgi:hypothetical protein
VQVVGVLPFHQRHLFFDWRPGLDTPSGFVTGPPVGPWTRSIALRQRIHTRVVHRTNQCMPRGSHVSR